MRVCNQITNNIVGLLSLNWRSNIMKDISRIICYRNLIEYYLVYALRFTYIIIIIIIIEHLNIQIHIHKLAHASPGIMTEY